MMPVRFVVSLLLLLGSLSHVQPAEARVDDVEVGRVRSPYTLVPAAGAGVYTLRLASPEGMVTVTVPADLRAGDRVSGRLTISSRRDRGLKPLRRIGLVVGETAVATAGGAWTATLPETSAGGRLPIRFRDPKGRDVAELSLPIAPRPPAAEPARFDLPRRVDGGEPLVLDGPFDGASDTTDVTIGGRPAEILAETPRRLTVALRDEEPPLGRQTLWLAERGVGLSVPIDVLAIELEASRPSLRKGERASLALRVSGLEDLDRDLRVVVENRRPEVSRLGGGVRQVLTIRPEDVAADDTFSWSDEVRALRTGGGSFAASIERAGFGPGGPEDPSGPGSVVFTWGDIVLFKIGKSDVRIDLEKVWIVAKELLESVDEPEIPQEPETATSR